jgi:hypothetical protein
MDAGLVVAVALAVAFAVTNGFLDAANSIAALVATRAATPVQAIVLASVFNLLGPLPSSAGELGLGDAGIRRTPGFSSSSDGCSPQLFSPALDRIGDARISSTMARLGRPTRLRLSVGVRHDSADDAVGSREAEPRGGSREPRRWRLRLLARSR